MPQHEEPYTYDIHMVLTQARTLQGSIHLRCLVQANVQKLCGTHQGLGERKMGSYCLMEMQRQCYMIFAGAGFSDERRGLASPNANRTSRCGSIGYSACLSYRKAWAPSPSSHKPGMLVHIHSPSEVKTGGLEAQDHPPPHSEFQASLGYMRPCLKKRNQYT